MRTLFVVLALLITAASGETPALSEKAAKYHSMLLKRPKPGAIYERFTSAWLEEGDIASLKTFLEARANDPKATTADRLVLGFFLSQQSEHDAAIATFAKALEADPANAEAWLLRAQAETRVSKFEDAIKSLDQVKTAQGETATDVAKLKARLLARTGKTDESLKVLKDLAAAHPEDEDLQDEVVELHLDEGLQAEAMDFLKALLERTKDPYQRVLRRLRLGDILKRMDKRDDALAAYSQCLDDAAQDSWVESEVLAQIEQTFRSKDDVNGLKDFLAKLAEKQERRLALGQLRARVLMDLGEGEAAITLHRELVQKNPTAASLKEAFIDMLARQQKFDDAVTQCRELLTQRPADKELRIHLATLLYQAKKPGEAVAELKPLVADAKTPEFELLRVARLYDGFDFQDDARKLYQRAADTWPDSATAMDALASYQHSHNNKISAVAIWKKQAAAPAGRDEVVRVARALGSRGENAAALEVLQAREKEFGSEAAYLSQLIAAANGAQRPELAKGWALTLVKMAKDGEALDDVLRQVRAVFRDEDVRKQVVKELQAIASLPINERCLLAELLEQGGDPEGADKVLAAAPEADKAIAQREQAHLYLLRQDYEKAAGILEKIAAAKKEAQIVEQLVTLHQRSSNFEAAMRWTQEWKQLMPGSSRPWTMEARLLQQQQKPEDAVQVLKLAARKFSDDVSMTTALAEAYAQNNQLADTQRIYQQLYDDAQDVSAQIRWAGQLAETAQRRGAIKELLEAFQERQRSNRTSLSPWLAIAEIHRRTNNYEGRRSALLEASRLKPKDIDLLHQIARVDEDQGEWRKAVETLTTASALDKTDKTKQRIAEIHLRYGDEETGLRLAFELSGGDNMDPRDAEGMILGLMARGNWKSAMTVIDPLLAKLPEDYRLRYLRMLSLIETNQPDAAINEAVALMDARKEVLTPSKSKTVTGWQSLMPTEVDPFTEMVNNVGGSGAMALRYRKELPQTVQNSSRFMYYYGGGGGSSGPQYWFIPQAVSMVKPYVTALLVQMKAEQSWDAKRVAEVVKKLSAAGHPVAETLEWFDPPTGNSGNLKLSASAVEQHIDNAALARFWIGQAQRSGALATLPASVVMQLQSRGINNLPMMGGKTPAADDSTTKLLNKILAHYENAADPTTAVQAAIKLWQIDPKQNAAVIDKVVAMAAKVPVRDMNVLYAFVAPFAFFNGLDANLRSPDGRKLRDAAITVVERYYAAHPSEQNWELQLPALHAAVGDWDAFAIALEKAMANTKKGRIMNAFSFSSGSVSIQPLSTYVVMSAIDFLPYEVTQVLMPRQMGSSGVEPMAEADRAPLQKASATLTNEELRALIAWRVDDRKTFEAYADKQKSADKPKLWPLLVRALETNTDAPAAACEWLQKARTATTDRDKLAQINAAFVHSVTNLKKDGKEGAADPFVKDAQSALLALRRTSATGSTYEIEQVLRAMESLGMKDEAERQKKLLASMKSTRSSSYSPSVSGPTADPYQLGRDLAAGKEATAIPQIVRALRTLVTTLATSTGYSNAIYQVGQWKRLADEQPKAAEKIWKQMSATAATTQKEKTERAILAEILGRSDQAQALYEELLKVKPRDSLMRYRLAMLLARQKDDPQSAVEHLMAVPAADLNNVARYQTDRFDGNVDPRERIRYGRVVSRYLQQMKGKAKEDDLDWCQRAIDVVMSASWGSNELPNILDEEQKVAEATKPIDAERRKVFDELGKAMLDYPTFALHILPAQFAIAQRDGGDVKPVMKLAKETLAAVAAIRAGSYGYGFGTSWEEGYNGSYNRRVWTPQVPEMLLFDAHERKAEKEFNDEIVPLIRLAYGTDAATDFGQRARLWFCPESEFITVAKERMARLKRASNNVPDTADIVRVWLRRDLKESLNDLLIDGVKDRMARNYGISDDTLTPYAKVLISRGMHDDLMKLIKDTIALMIGKPEAEWKDFVAKNPEPKSNTTTSSSNASAPAYQRINAALNMTQNLVRKDAALWMELTPMLQRAGFGSFRYFRYMVNGLESDALPEKAIALLPALERSGWLKSLPDFDPVQPSGRDEPSAFQSLLSRLQTKERSYTAPLVDELMKRQEKSPTLGMSLIIGKLAELTPDMSIALSPHAKAVAELPKEQQDTMLKIFRSVWLSFDRDVLKNPDLAPLAGSARKVKLEAVEKLLAAKTTKDFEPSDRDFENRMPEAIANALPLDAALAQRAFEHGVKLVMERIEKKDWNSNSWYNGLNRPSGLLERVCRRVSSKEREIGGKPSLENIAFAMRLITKPDQRSYLSGLGESDTEWGALLRAYWERSKGYADPRKATREMLTEVKRVMGNTSPALLCEAFRLFVHENMPRWYRAVILAEARDLAARDDELKVVATELAAGIGLEQHDPEAAKHLLRYIKSKDEHPFVRALLAAHLLDHMAADLKPEEPPLCCDPIIAVLEADGPGTAPLWLPLLTTLNQQPESVEWKALAERARTAWLHRARFNKDGLKAPLRFEPSRNVAPAVLELFARSNDEKALREIYDSTPKAFEGSVETSLVLARYGRGDMLKRSIKSSDGSISTNADHQKRTVKFSAADKEVTKVIDEALKDDPRLARRARLYAVAAMDSSTDAAEVRRNERLKIEAERFVADRKADPKIDDAIVKHLLDSVPACQVLAPALLPEVKWEALVSASLQNNNRAQDSLDMPIMLAFTTAIDGDDQAWKAMLASFKGSSSSSQWSALSFRIATDAIAIARHHGWSKCDRVIQRLREFLAIVPDKNGKPNEVNNVHLVLSILSDRTSDFDAWREKLGSAAQARFKPYYSDWFEYVLDAMPLKKDEDGGKVVLALLKHPWSQYVTLYEANFDYKGRWPKRLDDESLRKHTAEILAADPGNKAALDAVMNAWVGEKNPKPLLDAIKAVKPKCDKAKHAVALERMAAIEAEWGK